MNYEEIITKKNGQFETVFGQLKAEIGLLSTCDGTVFPDITLRP